MPPRSNAESALATGLSACRVREIARGVPRPSNAAAATPPADTLL